MNPEEVGASVRRALAVDLTLTRRVFPPSQEQIKCFRQEYGRLGRSSERSGWCIATKLHAASTPPPVPGRSAGWNTSLRCLQCNQAFHVPNTWEIFIFCSAIVPLSRIFDSLVAPHTDGPSSFRGRVCGKLQGVTTRPVSRSFAGGP